MGIKNNYIFLLLFIVFLSCKREKTILYANIENKFEINYNSENIIINTISVIDNKITMTSKYEKIGGEYFAISYSIKKERYLFFSTKKALFILEMSLSNAKYI
jgi:hypothetical protein